MREIFKKFDDVKEVFSNDFPQLKSKKGRVIYLDNANRTLIPIQVMDVIYDYNTRPELYFGEDGQDIIDKCRRKIADFMKIKDYKDIFVVPWSNSILHILIQTVLHILDDADGRNKIIVFQPSCYNETYIYLNNIAKHHRNFKLYPLKLTPNGKIDVSFLGEFNRISLALIQYVDHITGSINPIKEVAKVIHERGGFILLDCSLAAAHTHIGKEIEDMDIIYVAGDKMLAPYNIGFMWVNPNSQVYQQVIGVINMYKLDNLASYAGLSMAIDYLKAIGKNWIVKHESQLLNMLFSLLADLPQISTMWVDRRDKIGIVSINSDGERLRKAYLKVVKNNIYVGYGDLNSTYMLNYINLNSLMRISVYIYNWTEDIEKFISTFKEGLT